MKMAVKFNIATAPAKAPLQKTKAQVQKEKAQKEMCLEQLRELVPVVESIQKSRAAMAATLKTLDLKYTNVVGEVNTLVKELALPPTNTLVIFSADESQVMEVGKENTKREIQDKDRLVEILEGIEEGLPLKLAKFLLGDVDKYLTQAQQEEVVKTEYTGVRRVSAKEVAISK
jgi:hypothetical protein